MISLNTKGGTVTSPWLKLEEAVLYCRISRPKFISMMSKYLEISNHPLAKNIDQRRAYHVDLLDAFLAETKGGMRHEAGNNNAV